MAKNIPPTSNPAVDPFRGVPFNPFPSGSPLAATERAFAPRVTVQSAEEQTRAAGIPAEIRAGNAAPRFGDRPTPPPYQETTPVPTKPRPAAGGSKP